jgi:hypothetical protein
MEHNSLHTMGRRLADGEVFKSWSKKWQTYLRKTTSPKKGHQKNNPPKTTHFTIFLPYFYLILSLFIFRSIMVAT